MAGIGERAARDGAYRGKLVGVVARVGTLLRRDDLRTLGVQGMLDRAGEELRQLLEQPAEQGKSEKAKGKTGGEGGVEGGE